MKPRHCTSLLLSILFLLNVLVWSARAEETPSPVWYVDLMPFRYAFVQGDEERFRAQHWMQEGFASGINELSTEYTLKNGLFLDFEAGAIPSENDFRTTFALDKPDVGFFELDYDLFRKYYDGSGGVYRPFNLAKITDSTQDLKMDIGHFAMEFGPHLSDTSDVSLLYERHTKDGRKSRLTWTAVRENAVSRNIGPSWQDVEETVDSIALKGKTELAGFSVSGEQRFEFVNSDYLREEKSLSPTSVTASDKKIRRQYQSPEADLMTTSLRGEKWFLEDKAFASMGYRYNTLDSSEVENLLEYDENGNPRSFSNPKNKPNAFAENEYDSHSWVTHFSSFATKQLNFIAKLKTDVISRRGNSVYPSETNDPPDGIINTTEQSSVENKVFRIGENLGVRYSGLPKTNLYAELEMEQLRNWLSEERVSIAGQSASEAGEIFSRETLTHIRKTAWTIGGRTVPNRSWNFTTQFRRIMETNDYDDIAESQPGGSTARSAFFDALKIWSNEFTSKVGWKIREGLQTGFRYQYLDKVFFPRAENQTSVKTATYSHTFTYDILWQPVEKIFTNLSFSNQQMNVGTPASAAVSGRQPGFTADVHSILLSTSYVPREDVSCFASAIYSQSDNFDDFSSIGLPLGVDDSRLDLNLGMRWVARKNITIEPHYSYYMYDGDGGVEANDYTAQVIWLDVGFNW